MAGPTIKLGFEGDTTDLDAAFDHVGSGAGKMATSVGDSSKKAGSSMGGGLDRVGDSADGAESKFQGLSDVISGFSDTATAFAEGDVAGMAAGLASMAGGIAAFVVPVFGTLMAGISAAATATWTFTAALLANPITWIVLGVIALIAAIVLLIVYWDEVSAVVGVVVDWIVQRWNDVVSFIGTVGQQIGAFFVGAASVITGAFDSAVGWVRGLWEGLLGWFSSLPGKIGGFFSSIGAAIRDAFSTALNWVRNLWNNTIGGFGFDMPGFLGGGSIRIPRMHSGGIVPGFQGSEMLTILQAGERVIPNGGTTNGGATVTFVGNTQDALAVVIMQMFRTGQIQVSV